MFFTVFFIRPIFTLEMVVAVELFAKTDLVASPPPISRRAHQVVLTFAVSTIRMSVRLVTVAAFIVVAVTMIGKVALPRCVLRAVRLVFFSFTMDDSHPVLKREDRLRKHPFAGFGTVMEDI